MLTLLLTLSLLGGAAGENSPEGPPWGFFGHRRINQLAVHTLPPEVAQWLRPHIDYLAEHAVDPDKRRYATDYEAVRHYIDLDHWGRPPFEEVPRRYVDALIKYAGLTTIEGTDTHYWQVDTILYDRVLLTNGRRGVDLELRDYRRLWYRHLLPATRSGGEVTADTAAAYGLPLGSSLRVIDKFSDHGILPYHLLSYHRQLTQAFADKNTDRLLQLAAEMGHYVADAHVPLHTTENYNGQLTGQLGIHAFWESRLPELFADADYDYFVGPAEYIDDPADYYWDIVLASHALVDSVLESEARLRASYPSHQQLCYEERLGREVRTECEDYARAWSQAMDGMVEERFRAAIRSVGSVWYSCWVDAGQPDLPGLPAMKPTTTAMPIDTIRSSGSRRTHE